MYEKQIFQRNNEAEKSFITQIKSFSDNRASIDSCYELVEDANNLRRRIRKNELNFKIDEKLKKEMYSALSKYVGIILLIQSEEYNL